LTVSEFHGPEFNRVQATFTSAGLHLTLQVSHPMGHGLPKHIFDVGVFQHTGIRLAACPAPEGKMENIVFRYAQFIGGADNLGEV